MNNLKSKIVVFGLLVAMISCLFLLSGCGEATLSEIYVGKDGLPKKVSYVQGQELDLTGGVLTTVNSDGTTGSVPLTADTVTVTGYDKTTLGKQSLTVTYNGKTTTFDVTVYARFTAENFETNYFVGDEFDKTKGRVKIYRDNGTSFFVNMNDASVTVTAFDSSKAGKTTVSVQCAASDGNTYSGTFEVTIHEIAELEFKAPTKKVYNSHESFDFKGGYFTVKAGGGSNFSKYVNFTESMITGFDPAAVTEANLNTPVKQTVIFSYAGKQYEFVVDVYYSGVYYIQNAIEALNGIDWTTEDTVIPPALGERALEALKQYYSLSVYDQNLIDDEKFEIVVRPAAVYLHSLYLKEFDRFADVFLLTNSGFSVIAKNYAAVEAVLEVLKNPDDPFNVYADLLRDVYDDFGEVAYNETTKLTSKIFVHTEEYHTSITASFTYMLELYDMLKDIPDAWNDEILKQNSNVIEDAVTRIENSGYAGQGNIQLYRLVSKWRTNNDLLEIIYYYYMHIAEEGTEVVKTTLWKTVPMPGVLGEWYMATAQAANDAANMKKYKESSAYLYDVSMFMIYYAKSVALSNDVKTHENPLYKDVYNLLGGDTVMERELTGAEYGYLYHKGGGLDSEKIVKLWDEYLEILNVFMTNSSVSTKEYGKEFQDVFAALSDLSPAELYSFICSLHFQYSTSGGTTLVLDCREGVRSYFTYILAVYYSTVTPESNFEIFEKMLLAMENYALIGHKANALDEFKTLMAEIATDYSNLSPADRTTFDAWYGKCYQKYNLIYQLETGKTVALGDYEARFNELKNLITIFDEVFATINDAETTDERKNELVPVLFALYEKADSIRKEILASNNQDLIQAFSVLTYRFGEVDKSLDRKVCDMRIIFVSYLVNSFRTIDEQTYRAWDVYSKSKLESFVVESVYLMIQGYKGTPVENVGNVAQLMQKLHALGDSDKFTFMSLGFVKTFYDGAYIYYTGVYTNADVVKALLDADISYLAYQTGASEENAADFVAKFEALKTLYDALDDKATFEAHFKDLYEACLNGYNTIVAEKAE